MPIQGLTDKVMFPRVGKIRLGIKVKKTKPNGETVEYPQATQYFVVPPEVAAVYGEKPTELEIMLASEDTEIFAPAYYRMYSNLRGLVCKGDGDKAVRLLDKKTDKLATRESTETYRGEIPCPGPECEYYASKDCHEVMNLQFILPKVKPIGVWQIDTGSVYAMKDVYGMAELLSKLSGRIAGIPLRLQLIEQQVVDPEAAHKRTIFRMHISTGDLGYHELLQLTDPRQALIEISAPAVDESEPPDDRLLPSTTLLPENGAIIDAIAEQGTEDLFPEDRPSPVAGRGSRPDAQDKGIVPVRSTPAQKPPKTTSTGGVTAQEIAFFQDACHDLKWSGFGNYVKAKYNVSGQTVRQLLHQLTRQQIAELAKETQDRLEML